MGRTQIRCTSTLLGWAAIAASAVFGEVTGEKLVPQAKAWMPETGTLVTEMRDCAIKKLRG